MNFFALNDASQNKENWDEFILSSPFGHLFQTYEWGEISKALGWEPLRFGVEQDGRIRAAAQVLMRKRGPWSILYAPRGPIFDNTSSFNFLIANLKKVMIENRAIFFKINPAIEKPNTMEEVYKSNGFLKARIREMHICTYLVDLTKDADQIYAEFEPMVRRSIKKAQREGVTIEEANGQEGLDDFYRLYQKAYKRNNISYHAYDFVKQIWHSYAPSSNVKVFLAKYQNLAIAGVFVLLYGDKCEELWPATNEEYHNLRPNQLLHWQIFNLLKEKGYSSYNMGGVPPDKDKLPGIQFFKKSFGGKFVAYIGEYELPANKLLYCLWRKTGELYLKRNNLFRIAK